MQPYKVRSEADVNRELFDAEQQIKSKEKENYSLRDACDKDTKELYETIRKIEKKYDSQIKPIDAEKSLLESARWKLQRELAEQKNKKQVNDAISKGSFFEESFESYLLLFSNHIDSVGEKKAHENGIQVFSVKTYNASIWFAMKGLDCVGISYRRNGEHRGDSTMPFSYIGVPKEKNLVRVEKENRWHRLRMERATFTDWNKKLSELKDIKTFELSEKLIKAILDGQDSEGQSMDW